MRTCLTLRSSDNLVLAKTPVGRDSSATSLTHPQPLFQARFPQYAQGLSIAGVEYPVNRYNVPFFREEGDEATD
jgi:hypothetical protein